MLGCVLRDFLIRKPAKRCSDKHFLVVQIVNLFFKCLNLFRRQTAAINQSLYLDLILFDFRQLICQDFNLILGKRFDEGFEADLTCLYVFNLLLKSCRFIRGKPAALNERLDINLLLLKHCDLLFKRRDLIRGNLSVFNLRLQLYFFRFQLCNLTFNFRDFLRRQAAFVYERFEFDLLSLDVGNLLVERFDLCWRQGFKGKRKCDFIRLDFKNLGGKFHSLSFRKAAIRKYGFKLYLFSL